MLLNLQRAMSFLQRSGLDAMVATSWPNILYCSDFHLWLQPVFKSYMSMPGSDEDPMSLFVVLTKKGSGTLVLDHMCELAASSSWISNRYVYGPVSVNTELLPEDATLMQRFRRSPNRFQTPIQALVAALEGQQLSGGRIGLDMETMPLSKLSLLRSALPTATFLDATNLFRLIRMVKSDEEIRRLRQAAKINCRAGAESLALARPCQNIQVVARRFNELVASSNATFDHFAFSQAGIGFATENDYEPQDKEALFIDFGCKFQHYYSDAGTTLFAGTPGRREIIGYRTLVDCLQRTAEQMLPGVSTSSIQAFMQQFLDSNGMDGQFPHGHGIGIELRDYPILAPDGGRRIADDCVDVSADLPLEEDMVINLEAPVFELNGSALQLEQTYVVKSTGAVPLIDRDLSTPIVAYV